MKKKNKRTINVDVWLWFKKKTTKDRSFWSFYQYSFCWGNTILLTHSSITTRLWVFHYGQKCIQNNLGNLIRKLLGAPKGPGETLFGGFVRVLCWQKNYHLYRIPNWGAVDVSFIVLFVAQNLPSTRFHLGCTV